MPWNFSVERTARLGELRRPMRGTFAAKDPRVEEAAQLVAGRKCGSGTIVKPLVASNVQAPQPISDRAQGVDVT
jgi:hypothetical protein